MTSSVRRFVLSIFVTAASAGLLAGQQQSGVGAPELNAPPPAAADTVPLLLIGPGTGGMPTQIVNGATLGGLGGGFPFGATFGAGIRTAIGELSGDTTSDYVIGMGPGGGLVRLFNGATIGEIASGYPFGAQFTGGVSVATGDVTGDGRVDIIVGQATGGGTVMVFDGRDIGLVYVLSPFGGGYAGGVNVAAGDVNGDGRADIIVGQAVGGLVTVVSGASGASMLTAAAYAPPTGAFVAAGDVTGDGRAEIIAAPGAGAGAVLVYDVSGARLLTALAPYATAPGGIRVAAADVDGDGRAEIFTVPGPGAAAELRAYSGATFALRGSALIYPAGYAGGAFVAAVPPGHALRFTSATATSFVVGSAGSFTVTTTGVPSPVLSIIGTLPAGVTFVDNGNGTATLGGTPGASTGGSYPVTLRATPPVGAPVTQPFVLTVSAAPALTSATTATFTAGAVGSHAITSTGVPAPTISLTGALPAGVVFAPGNGGTATVSGTPGAGSGGTYALDISASNGIGTPAAQTLTLTVQEAPSITSAAAAAFDTAVFQSRTITTTGFPRPTLSLTGTLPSGVTFTNNGDGTATIAGAPAPTSAGTYNVTLGATNGIGSAATQPFVLTVTSSSNAANDTFGNGVGNTQYSVGLGPQPTPAVVVSGSVLDNDTGIGGLSAGPTDQFITTTQLGRVDMASNGAFLYTPPVGFAGPSDTFVYTMSDSVGHVETATVTINMTGVVWYVRQGGSGDGRSQNPFGALNTATAAAGPGHALYVHTGTVGGSAVLKTGQTLWGAGAAFVLNGLTIASGATPTLTGTIALASGVAVQSVNVNTPGAPAITGASLTGATTLNAVAILGGSSGLSLTGVTGSVTMTGGAISGVTGTGVSVASGTGTIAVGAPITTASGRSVDVQGTSGGTVSFAGAISDTGDGIYLDGNPGATIAFTGGVTVATDSTTAFTAINGGTVTATQNNTTIVNSLASTSGDGLRVANTSIGSAGLTFRRISSGNNGYGAGVGITLDTTGLAVGNGGLTVTGNGTSGSGGVIRRKSGVDGSVTSGLGIYLHDTKAPAFRWMELSDFDNGAIVGHNVAGFSLEDSIIDGGLGTTASEGGLMFGSPDPSGVNGLVGAGLLRNTRISGAAGHTGAFYAQSGAMTLQIDGTTRPACALSANSSTTGGDGLQVWTQGTATATVTVTRCQFRGNRNAGLRLLAEDDSAIVFSLSDADVHSLSGQGQDGVVLRNAGNGQLTASIDGNSFDQLPGANLWIGQAPFDANAASLMQVTVTGLNAFEQPGGAATPPWVMALSSTIGQASRTRVRFQNGLVGLLQARQSESLRITTPDAGTSPAADITVIDNHGDTDDTSTPYTAVIAATQPGANLCTNLRTNTFHWNPDGQPAGGGPILLTQSGGATFRLERGDASLVSAPSAVLTTNNPQTLNQVAGTITVVENGTCLLPTP